MGSNICSPPCKLAHSLQVRHTDSKEVLVMKAVSLQGLSEKDRSDTLNEARLMQELSHENVIRWVDITVVALKRRCHLEHLSLFP